MRRSADAKTGRMRRVLAGGAPPPGDAQHWSCIVVDALDVYHVAEIGVQPDSTPALMGFYVNAGGHLLERAVISPVATVPVA